MGQVPGFQKGTTLPGRLCLVLHVPRNRGQSSAEVDDREASLTALLFWNQVPQAPLFLQVLVAASVSQKSEVEGAGKSARFGNPKQGSTIAIKRALALRDPRVLGTLAQLGSVQDGCLSELLSAHLGSALRTLVVDSRECRCATSLGSITPLLDGPVRFWLPQGW
jgi:hypothetical protein